MNSYIWNLWDKVRISYWFIPSLFGMAGLACAFLLPYVDYVLITSDFKLPAWLVMTNDTAKVVLTGLSGSMLTVTGTIFSITIVTFSLTSQQFGPRLLRRFMYDLITQVTLGILIATSIYSLIVLRVLERKEELGFTPNLTVLFGLICAVGAIAMLVVFLHNIATLVQAPNIIEAVARDLRQCINDNYSQKKPMELSITVKELKTLLKGPPLAIPSAKAGYVQAIETKQLFQIACTYKVVVTIVSAPGDFVAEGSPLVELYASTNNHGGIEAIRAGHAELTQRLNDQFAFGNRPTPRQCILCAINELVEVAVRSLSPGINDPYTAVTCIDHLSNELLHLHKLHPNTEIHLDQEEQVRLIEKIPSYQTILLESFRHIIEYGKDHTLIGEALHRAEQRLGIQFIKDCQRENAPLPYKTHQPKKMAYHQGRPSLNNLS